VGEIVPEWLVGSMVRGGGTTKEGGKRMSCYEGRKEEKRRMREGR
jgi:hypothetical protein